MADTSQQNSTAQQQNPLNQGPKPPFPQKSQQYPGSDNRMQPEPDHGEKSYKGSGKLTGKTALITGADSGIGRAVAIAFAREGADVLISYLSEENDARETARWVEEAGRKAILVPGDVANEAHCQALVQRALNDFGHLDILVNNAAFQNTYEDITQIPSDEFERTYRINVFALFYLAKAAVPHMKPGSAIINTASIEAFEPKSFLLPYASTKSAIASITRSMAELIGQKGIRVNAVAPGPVWTPLIPATMPESAVKDFGKSTVLGRPAQPAELAPIYVLLASPEASYVTGEIYGVTGGKMPL
ncbi:MAG TPA: glucose 1-dehydrogenase [Chloroflexia bacterium]|nr:glucose 1-dehydrogenase [Chloroflexia bacterium]